LTAEVVSLSPPLKAVVFVRNARTLRSLLILISFTHPSSAFLLRIACSISFFSLSAALNQKLFVADFFFAAVVVASLSFWKNNDFEFFLCVCVFGFVSEFLNECMLLVVSLMDGEDENCTTTSHLHIKGSRDCQHGWFTAVG
jgi:hypothetical protein